MFGIGVYWTWNSFLKQWTEIKFSWMTISWQSFVKWEHSQMSLTASWSLAVLFSESEVTHNIENIQIVCCRQIGRHMIGRWFLQHNSHQSHPRLSQSLSSCVVRTFRVCRSVHNPWSTSVSLITCRNCPQMVHEISSPSVCTCTQRGWKS